jgi:hypothetical protein
VQQNREILNVIVIRDLPKKIDPADVPEQPTGLELLDLEKFTDSIIVFG